MGNKLGVLLCYFRFRGHMAGMDRDMLEKHQKKRLKRHLRRVTREIPFYRAYKGKPLAEFPVVDKQVFMDRFGEMNRFGIKEQEAIAFAAGGERSREFSGTLRGVTVGLSSGTSGRRGAFLVGPGEQRQWAGYILARFLPKGLLKGHCIAFFMRANSNLYTAVGAKQIRFEFFDIYAPLEGYTERLNRLAPDILVGQPSVLLGLLAQKRQGSLCIGPATIISIAEVLEDGDAALLRQGFGVPVIHQVYQCTEGCLGTTCAMGHLHLNEDLVHVERQYLDEHRFVPVVTDFYRRTQPVIRYRLNDILVEDPEPCPCGSSFLHLKKIEGREDDVFSFAAGDGKTQVQVFPDFIRRCMLLAGEINDYRVVLRKDVLRVYMPADPALQKAVLREFETLAKDCGFCLPPVEFYPYTYDNRKKLKRVEREDL